MKKTLSLFFIFFSSLCVAQVDSLKDRLSETTGEEKLKVLNRLTALDSTPAYFAYHKEAMALAKKMNDPSGEVHALRAMGDHHKDRDREDSTFFYYNKSLSVAKAHKLQREIIQCLDRSAFAMDIFGHYDQALLLYKEAIAESRKLNDKKEIAIALEQLAVFHNYYRNDSLAIKYFNDQLEITKEIKDSAMMSKCLNNIGIIYYNRSEYENCIQYYKKSLVIEKKLHKDTAVAESYLNIGIVYIEQGNYVAALENLLESAHYLKKLGPSKSLASCYSSIGSVYLQLKEIEKSLFYHYLSLRIRQQLNLKRSIALSYTNIAETYKEQGKYDLALMFINRSIKLKEELGEKSILANSLDILGEIYFLKKDFVLAESYYLQCIALRQGVKDPKGEAKTRNKMGALYLEWGKYELAWENLDKARIIATTTGMDKVLLENYAITITSLKAAGRSDELPRFYEEYTALKEDIVNEEKNKVLTEMEVKYKMEEKDQQIALFDAKEKAQAAQLSQQKTLIYSLAAGAFLLIVITFLSINAYRSGAKSNKQSKIIIEQKQALIEQKQTMMKELHHRVKNNLQLLASLLKLQYKRLDDPATKEAIKAVEHRLNAMLLIHQDLYGESADADVDMKIYVRKMVDNLLFSSGNSNVKVKLNLLTDELFLDAGKALNIGFIFNEVINNAFKHAFTDTAFPVLDITIRKDETAGLVFSIADNGKGISVEHNPEEADSFGLRLIHMLVKEMKGSITIVSDKGSCFEFIIPIHTDAT